MKKYVIVKELSAESGEPLYCAHRYNWLFKVLGPDNTSTFVKGTYKCSSEECEAELRLIISKRKHEVIKILEV